jgi:hypothetical protein
LREPNHPRLKTVLPKFVHYMTGVGILLKAFAKLEHPEGYGPVIILFFISGAAIIAVTALHDRLHHHQRYIDAGVMAIECVVMAIVAMLAFKEGGRYYPYGFVIASVFFAVATIVRLVKKPR